jgi:hypothetical protein
MRNKIFIGVVVIAAALLISFLAGDYISPRGLTRSAITETFVRIHLFAQQSQAIPSSLDVLPRRAGYANRTTDGWGRPLLYERSNDGIIRLTSLGRDGQPGGQAADADMSTAFHSRKTDGSLWVTSALWIVEAELRDARPGQEAAPCSNAAPPPLQP